MTAPAVAVVYMCYPAGEIGTLNVVTAESRAAALARIDGGRIYDPSGEYFVGMPSWYLLGDPS